MKRWGNMVASTLLKKKKGEAASNGAVGDINEDTELTREQFEELLGKIDKGLRALPATAQVRV